MKKIILILLVTTAVMMPCTVFAETAKDAIHALVKLEAKLQSRIYIRDIPAVIGDAKADVNIYLRSAAAKKNKKMAESISKALDHFEFASIIMEQEAFLSPEQFVKIESKTAKAILIMYPEANKSTDDGGFLYKPEGAIEAEIFLPTVREHAMRAGSQMIEKATALLTK